MKDKIRVFNAIGTSKALTPLAKGAALDNLGKARRLETSTKQEMPMKVSGLANVILTSDVCHNMESWQTKAFDEGVPSIYHKLGYVRQGSINITRQHTGRTCPRMLECRYLG